MTTNGELHTVQTIADHAPSVDRPDIIKVLMTGDLSSLNDEQKLYYYAHECHRMKLDPAARPLEWFRSKDGKILLYAKRSAGDMLAVLWNVSTDIVDGPKLIAIGSRQVIYVRVRATMPSGRHVEDVGTVSTEDPFNGTMKAVTKASRRATLRICGWGGVSEDDLDAIERYAPTQVTVEAKGEVAQHPELQDLAEKLLPAGGHANSIEGVIGLYNDVRRAVDDPRVHSEAHRMCRDYIESQGWRKKTEFQKATMKIEDEIATAKRTSTDRSPSAAMAPAAPDVTPGPLPSPSSPGPARQTSREPVATGTVEMTNQRPEAASAPAATEPASVAPGADTSVMDAFNDDLVTCETSRQCVATWRKHMVALKTLSQADRIKAWQALCACTEDVGQHGADEWLKAELRKPAESDAGSKPAEAPSTADANEEHGDAWEGEDSPIGASMPATNNASDVPVNQTQLLSAINALRECNGPTHVARHFAAHIDDLPPGAWTAYREATVDWIRKKYGAKIRTDEKANTVLDEAIEAHDNASKKPA